MVWLRFSREGDDLIYRIPASLNSTVSDIRSYVGDKMALDFESLAELDVCLYVYNLFRHQFLFNVILHDCLCFLILILIFWLMMTVVYEDIIRMVNQQACWIHMNLQGIKAFTSQWLIPPYLLLVLHNILCLSVFYAHYN